MCSNDCHNMGYAIIFLLVVMVVINVLVKKRK